MRILLFILLLSFIRITSFSQFILCNTLNDLNQIVGSNNYSVLVKDKFSGGIFYYSEELLKVDSGIVFNAKGPGFWIRRLDPSQSINPCWWGAKGNGVNDDHFAIQKCIDYGLLNKHSIQFPSGIFRISKQIIIGAKPVDEIEFRNRNITSTKSWNSKEYVKARFTNSIIIKGDSETIIYGDFNRDSTESIFYFGTISNGNSNSPKAQYYNSEIRNIGFYGKGSFIGKKFSPTEKNIHKQIGIAVFRVPFLKIESCKFYGLDVGVLTQDAYFSNYFRLNFANCNTGLLAFGHNATQIENIVGDNCKVAMKISGSVVSCSNVTFEYCSTGLEFTGEGLIMNGLYCENDQKSRPNVYQIIFKNATGVVINVANITSGGRDIIFVDKESKNIRFVGSTLYGDIVNENLNNKIVFDGVKGKYLIKKI